MDEVLSPKDLTELSLHLAEEQDEHHHHHHLQQPLVISPQNEVMTHANRYFIMHHVCDIFFFYQIFH